MESHYWVPWRLLVRVPLVRSIVPGRFFLVTTLCAAVLLAVVVDRTHTLVAAALSRRAASRPDHAVPTVALPALAAATMALAVAAAALVPIGWNLADNIPITTRTVTLPRWFAQVAPHLPPGQVVLTVPAPFSLIQAAMAWQAVDSLHFALVGGGGPEGLPRAGRKGTGRAGGGELGVALSLRATGTHVPAMSPPCAGLWPVGG